MYINHTVIVSQGRRISKISIDKKQILYSTYFFVIFLSTNLMCVDRNLDFMPLQNMVDIPIKTHKEN